MKLSELIGQAVLRGYIPGVSFYDVLYKRPFVVQSFKYTDFGKNSIKLYVKVNQVDGCFNKTACIYYKGKWAKFVDKSKNKTDDMFYYNLFEYNKRRSSWTEEEVLNNCLGR